MLLSDFIEISKELSRDGADVVRVRLRYPLLDEVPAAGRINNCCKKTAEAYLRYAETLAPAAQRGTAVTMTPRVWIDGGYISIIFDIVEYEGDGRRACLVNYRRVSQVWDAAGGFIIPDALLIRSCIKKEKTKKIGKYDGCFIRDGKLYIYINHYKKGAEQGVRRSQYRKFIEEKCLGTLPDREQAVHKKK